MTRATSSLLLLLVIFFSISASADPEIQYHKPSASITEIAERSYLPIYNIDPTRRWLMRLDPGGMAPMELLAREELHLAGLRIRKESRARSRRLFANAIAVVDVTSGVERRISGFPDHPIIQYVLWSPNGEYIGALVERESQVELWLVTVETASAKRLSPLPVNSGMDDLIAWSSDSQSIWIKAVADDLGPSPVAPPVSTGVLVRETSGEPVPAQTHQGVLQTRFDVERFEYYFSSRLTQVMLDGTHRHIGDSGVYRYVRPSPDNHYLLVERLTKPWSYFVQEDQFGYKLEVLDLESGETHGIASAPLAEALPYSGGWVRTGARNFGWRSDAPSTVVWVEALDGGNSYQDFKYRDHIMSLNAPFKGVAQEIAVFRERVGDVVWHQHD
jgi:transposase